MARQPAEDAFSRHKSKVDGNKLRRVEMIDLQENTEAVTSMAPISRHRLHGQSEDPK